ncbi:hypothetical protein [Pseudanabaena phage PA-SR01]|nr:hypothetical protein [Pseudanabaena phage PA-SR01]
MWKLLQDTPKRLPTWVGGTSVSPYTSGTTNTIDLSQHTVQASYLTTLNFLQRSKLPFLVGFNFVSLGVDGYNNSGSRNATPDLNACYYLTVGSFPTSKTATFDFYFADLNSYKDLDWVNYYPNAIIYKDKDTTAYKVSDIKGLFITDRTTIKIRLDFDIFLPFLGFSSFKREKKLRKLVGAQVVGVETVSYYGQIYRFDKYLDFGKNTFFMQGGDLYLCP